MRAPKKINILNEGSIIKLYPNPANTQVTVDYHSESDGQFTLTNSMGEVVLKTTLIKGNSKTQISINDISNGIYHYEISFAGGQKSTGNLSILK